MKRFAFKSALLASIILLMLLALPVAALADGAEAGNEFTQTVDGYQVTLAFDKPAAAGENQLHIRLKDGQSRPVPGADVEVGVVTSETALIATQTGADAGMADMPGMAGMPGMSNQPAQTPAQSHDAMGMEALAASQTSGEYSGQIAIEKAGDIVIRAHITIQGKLSEVDFPLAVAQSQNGSGILTGFIFLNTVIISTAVIMKPKAASATLLKEA
jgi:hypothetical protein